MSAKLKKFVLTAFCFLFAIDTFAPDRAGLILGTYKPLEPFKSLIFAVGMFESEINPLAFNQVEQAAGFLQIRPIRLLDYNKRTGNNYSMNDLFRYDVSEKIFLYYASQMGPYNFERIARSWNGSGESTIIYWNEVKKFL
jgi:hypothetical protein